MKPFENKTSPVAILNIIWIFISVPLILWGLWSLGLNKAYNIGVQEGFTKGRAQARVQAYGEVIQAANNERCAQFPVDFQSPSGEKMSINLIKADCVRNQLMPQVSAPAIDAPATIE